MFEKAWLRVVKKLLRGEQLEPVPVVLEHKANSTEKAPLKGKGYAEVQKRLSEWRQKGLIS